MMWRTLQQTTASFSFLRGLSHKFMKARSSASRGGDLQRLPRTARVSLASSSVSRCVPSLFFFCQRPCGFASSTSALPAASATLHTRAHRKMQTVASFGQKGVLMEDEKPVRLLTEGGKKRSRWKRVDGGGGSLFSLKSVFRRKRGTNFRLKGQSTPKSNLDPSSELQPSLLQLL